MMHVFVLSVSFRFWVLQPSRKIFDFISCFQVVDFLVTLCNFLVLIRFFFLLGRKRRYRVAYFLSLLFVFRREYEPIRLLSLQLLGRLLVDLPSEKKGPRFFNLTVGRSRFLLDGHKKISMRMQPIFSAMSDRLFRFPQTDNLCATLFDVLLGGASPKQVLFTIFKQTRKGSGYFILT